MKKLVVLSGAGVSAESGLKTFRDSGGLWEGYNVMDVASPEGWARDKGIHVFICRCAFLDDRKSDA